MLEPRLPSNGYTRATAGSVARCAGGRSCGRGVPGAAERRCRVAPERVPRTNARDPAGWCLGLPSLPGRAGLCPSLARTMQNYTRMKFLHDCIVRFAPSTGVALEVGCYKCSSTVFIAHACGNASIEKNLRDRFVHRVRPHGERRWTTSPKPRASSRVWIRRPGHLIRSNSLDYRGRSRSPSTSTPITPTRRCGRTSEVYTPFLVEGGIVVFDDYDVDHRA